MKCEIPGCGVEIEKPYSLGDGRFVCRDCWEQILPSQLRACINTNKVLVAELERQRSEYAQMRAMR